MKDDGRSAEAIVRRIAEADAGTNRPCLDGDVVAAFLSARLSREERGGVVSHLGECAACRTLVADVDSASADDAPSVIPVRRTRWRVWHAAAAAAVLVAATAVVWRSAALSTMPTQERLVAAAAELRASHADVFQGFEPLSAADLAARGAAERGGFRLRGPRGAVLDASPLFFWTAVPGAEAYELTVRGSDGRVVAELTTPATSVSLPAGSQALRAGGAYAWSVTARGPAGEAEGSQSFRIASDAERSRYERGIRAIEAESPPRLRAVLSAQWALRLGLFDEALRLLAAPPMENRSEVERETLDLARRALGEEIR